MIHQGDCLEVLKTLPDSSVDAVVTDPPYSSGGLHRGDRTANVASKYVQSGSKRFAAATFSGDSRDQRSWGYWCTLWLSECLRIAKPSAYCLVFTDWRQLPTMTDVFQASGWVWRGIVSWDKGLSARAPHTGYFRHQCEYVVWGTKGVTANPGPGSGGPWAGCVRHTVTQADKHHMVGKPTSLMRDLVQCCPRGGVVLDPFMGSGTTGVACVLEGRQFVGIEQVAEYVQIAKARIAEVTGPLFSEV